MNEYSGIASFISLLLILVSVSSQLASLKKRLAALSRVDAKLDLLLKHAGIEFDPYPDVPRDVIEALQRGEIIQAIKLYREATGLGLKDAKEAVEEIQRRAGGDASP